MRKRDTITMSMGRISKTWGGRGEGERGRVVVVLLTQSKVNLQSYCLQTLEVGDDQPYALCTFTALHEHTGITYYIYTLISFCVPFAQHIALNNT